MYQLIQTSFFFNWGMKLKNSCLLISLNFYAIYDLDLVCTVPGPHGHSIKLNGSKTSVALTLTIVLQNLTTNCQKNVLRVNMTANYPNAMS